MNSSINYKELGCAIKHQRSVIGISQEQLAIRANISSTHLSNIENGRSKPSLETLYTISSVLNCSISQLICKNQFDVIEIDEENMLAMILKKCNSNEYDTLNDFVRIIAKYSK